MWCSVSCMFCKAISTLRRPLFIFKYVFARQSILCGDLCSVSSMILQGHLYNAATSVHFQVSFARQSILCGDLYSFSSMFCKAISTMQRPLFIFKYVFARQSKLSGDLCSVSSMFCKAIYTMWRPCSVSSMFCKAISTMWRPLFIFTYVLQGNLYNAVTSVHFQVCFARQYIHSGDLCAVSSMFCKAIYTLRRPLFCFNYVLHGNLYHVATSVQFQVCFARQSTQCTDLCSVSSIFSKAIYTMRRTLFSFKYVLQGNLYHVVTSVQFQVCFARQSVQCGNLCSVSSMFCKAIYTMGRPLFSFKYILQGDLYIAASSVQFQVCFAR